MHYKLTKQLTMIIILCLGCFNVQAQQGGDFDLNFQIKTNHLWHGFIVTPGIMTAGTLSYLSEDEKTKFGIWGGATFNGEFKEFTYFASHNFSENMFVEIVNHGNHSSIQNVDIFDYSTDSTKTGNFIDIGFGYTFSGDMPVSVYYSVIIQGVDTYIDEDSGKKKQSYTNYLELQIPAWQGKKGESVNVFVGGAFSPVDSKNFYDDKANITNVGFTYKKELEILNYTLPISATAMWNPALNIGALEVAFNFF